MENHNTHLAPAFTLNDLVPAPANVIVLPGSLGPCLWGTHTASTRCPLSRGTNYPHVALRPLDSWRFTLPTRALPDIELWSFRLCAPPVYRVLMEFKPSPFSFLLSPFLVQSLRLFTLFHFLSRCFAGGGVLFLYSPPISILSLHAKVAPCPPQLLSPLVYLSA